MPSSELTECLRRVLEGGPRLRLALLFGSAAGDASRTDSDVDVAILPADPRMTFNDELELQVRLSNAVRREVDLVRLDRASSLLRWRVACGGVRLLADPAYELPRFRARAAIEHADMQPQLHHAQELIRRRLAHGEAPAADPDAEVDP